MIFSFSCILKKNSSQRFFVDTAQVCPWLSATRTGACPGIGAIACSLSNTELGNSRPDRIPVGGIGGAWYPEGGGSGASGPLGPLMPLRPLSLLIWLLAFQPPPPGPLEAAAVAVGPTVSVLTSP